MKTETVVLILVVMDNSLVLRYMKRDKSFSEKS